jgi:hypothetical protein
MLAPCWTKLMCNRSAGELDVLLLMLCIQKRCTRSGCGSPRRWRQACSRPRSCLCEAQGLLLCADNDDVEGFFGCSKQSIRRRPIQPPVCGRPHLRQDE